MQVMEKQWEMFVIDLKKFIKKDDYREMIKQQSKLTFNGIHKSYENFESYTFKKMKS